MSFTSHLAILASLVTLALTPGCATIGRVGNLTDIACQSTFSQALSSVLVEQDETQEIADSLAERTAKNLSDHGPRPFLVASPSGTDYTFFVQLKKPECLLRLYGRRRGFVSYTNNLTYIATKPLPHCVCSE
ncbi:hypothetical protein [Dokdonella soli]|uniref:DUF4156 domain-containing protein n=1 Tax=Dokdonella soli TaxID=529810 RepID=A0ABP3TXX4_9GAMM